MYFKLHNKLLKINSYIKLKELINTLNKPYTYILINNIHYSQLNNDKFTNLPLINNININYKLKGGFIDSIIETLVVIYKFLLLIPKIVLWLVEFIIWIVRLSVFILKSFLSLLTGGFKDIIKNMLALIASTPITFIKQLIKQIFGDGVIENKTLNPDYRCYGPKDDGTIPTTILISTILCPPLGVFMMYGIKGWLYILISALLSLIYYIPGIIYALIIFYT